MSEPTLDAIHSQLGQILRELGSVGTGQSELHVKVDSVERIVKRVADDRMRDRFDIDRAHRRITSLEHQVALVSQNPAVPDWRPDPREITGTHDLAVIKAQHEEMRAEKKAAEDRRTESGIWWQRQRTLWIMAAFGALCLTAFSACATVAISHFVK